MRHDLIVIETWACCEQVQETLGEKPNGTAFAITLHAAPTLDATNLVVGKASLCLPRCLVVNAGNPRRAFWPCSFGGLILLFKFQPLIVSRCASSAGGGRHGDCEDAGGASGRQRQRQQRIRQVRLCLRLLLLCITLTLVLSSVCCPNQRVHH